jgi:hypothetical protein
MMYPSLSNRERDFGAPKLFLKYNTTDPDPTQKLHADARNHSESICQPIVEAANEADV